MERFRRLLFSHPTLHQRILPHPIPQFYPTLYFSFLTPPRITHSHPTHVCILYIPSHPCEHPKLSHPTPARIQNYPTPPLRASKTIPSTPAAPRSGRFSYQKSRLYTSGYELPRAGDRSRSERENHVLNRYFSENPRWGPYKNHENVTKNRSARGNCRKTMIFTF